MNVYHALDWATRTISKNSASPQLDAEVILSFILKKPRAYLLAHPKNKLNPRQEKQYKKLINLRLKNWPVAYLTGEKEFYSLDFMVTYDTLIPRPETELMVEIALKKFKKISAIYKYIIDLGTGSGCVIISLAKYIKNNNKRHYNFTRFIGIDNSKKALKIAKINARRHKLGSKIKFLHGHLLKPLQNLPSPGLEGALILANLPYVKTKQMNEPSIKHEPRGAIHGGRDGLKNIRQLFSQISSAPAHFPNQIKSGNLFRNLTILIEHDPAQKPPLTKLAQSYLPMSKPKFHKDLARKYRVMEIQI